MRGIEAGNHRRRVWRTIRWGLFEMILGLALVGGAAFALSGCTVETGSDTASTASAITTVTQSAVTTASTTAASPTSVVTTTGQASPAETVATILGPSVVNIKVSGSTSQGPFGQQRFEAEGSGVIYSSSGMIVTNNHVVTDEYGDPVSDIEVTLITGEKLPATIVGRDELTDLAVIKVNPSTELPFATFASSDPKVGEYAVAIGSPLGFENSVTLGIVSALNRSIDMQSATGEILTYTNLIQTDTPISSGNSGGALANAQGQVIGINQSKISSAEAENIGFAISSTVVTKVADEIISAGKATHAYLGVSTRTVTEEMQQQFGLSRSSGVLVAQVSSGSPADKAGMKQGDIIVKIDDKDMVDASDVLGAIRDNKPGDTIQVTIDRDGKTSVLSITLEQRPAELT